MPKKGRPAQSQIRQNMIELLFRLGSAYGYQLSKLYSRVFPPATRRVIYYHLKKGIQLGEFEVHEIKREQGDFSWGSVVEKTYYKLGRNARPVGDPRLSELKQNTEETTVK